MLNFTFQDIDGQSFFSINVFVDVEDEPAYIEDGPRIYPLKLLNELNAASNTQ